MVVAHKILDKAASIWEYLIALAFILSAIALIGEPALKGGLMAAVFGSVFAYGVYFAWFMFLGLGLVYVKIRKHKTLHKNMLLLIYLTTIYTAVLSFYFGGITEIIDDIIIGTSCAALWLRWKFKTEYIDPRQFHSSVEHFKEDPPPLP